MSDEEKKAIQMIKNQKEEVDEALIAMEIPENYIGEDVEQEYLEWQKNADIILNLIEKQQKEIEELKNGQIDFWISDKEIEERIRNKFVNKDKIKAIIEELRSDEYMDNDYYIPIIAFEKLLQEEENNEC